MSLKSSNKVDTNRYELVITVDAETFADAVSKAYRKNVKKMNIPGFRRGKAPRAIIERMYGEDVFYNDALEAVYPSALQSAVEEANLEIVDNDIDFDLVSMDKTGVEFKVKITVKPEVEIGEYKGLAAEKPETDAADADVEEELKRLQERNSRIIAVEGRAAEMGDTVVFDFEGFVDGTAFEGGKGESYSLVLGSGQFIPGFEEQIAGHNVADEFEVNVTFPEDYHAEELKGKAAVFKCKLHEIKAREMPVVDDEFAKDVSEFDTVDALKEDLKKKIEERKEKQADSEVETQLIDKLLEGFQAEIPNGMIESRIDENLRDFDYRLQMQGMSLQQYIQYMGGDAQGLRDSFKEQAERQVKVRLALEKIVALEGIAPTAEEIEAEYEKLKDLYKVEMDKIKKAIPEKEVIMDLSLNNAIELIKSTAVISPKKAEKAPVKKTTKKTGEKKAAEGEKKPAAKKSAKKTENQKG